MSNLYFVNSSNLNPCCNECPENQSGGGGNADCCDTLNQRVTIIEALLQQMGGGNPNQTITDLLNQVLATYAKQYEVTVGFENAQFLVKDHNHSGSQAIQCAVDFLSAKGGGLIRILEGVYPFTTTVNIPQYAGIFFVGSGFARVRESQVSGANKGGTRLKATVPLNRMFNWQGQNTNLTDYNQLANSLMFRDLFLEGAGNADWGIYALNTDHLFLDYVRIENCKSGSVDFDSTNNSYPIAGSAKPGGIRITNCALGGAGGKQALRIKDCTQNWIFNTWFENDANNRPNEWIELISCDKTNIVNCEFNLVTTGGCAVRLKDAPNAPNNGLVFTNNKVDVGNGSFDIIDLRTNSDSRGVVVADNNYISGSKQKNYHNLTSVLRSGAGVYTTDNESLNSFVDANQFNLIGGLTNNTPSKRQVNFRTGWNKRFEIEVNEEAETGGNKGSNFAINRFNDAGSYIDTVLKFIRETGAMIVQNFSTFLDNVKIRKSNSGQDGVLTITSNKGTDTKISFEKIDGNNDEVRYQLGVGKETESGNRGGSNLFLSQFNNSGNFDGFVFTHRRDEVFGGILSLLTNVSVEENRLVRFDANPIISGPQFVNKQVGLREVSSLGIAPNGVATITVNSNIIRPDSILLVSIKNYSGPVAPPIITYTTANDLITFRLFNTNTSTTLTGSLVICWMVIANFDI